MPDRSDKIVNLAREMLRETDFSHSADQLVRHELGWKGVAFVGMLTAATAGAGVAWLSESARPLNRAEKVEIMALVHYAARMRQQPEDSMRDGLYEQFGITSLDDLSYRQLDRVRTWLHTRISPDRKAA